MKTRIENVSALGHRSECDSASSPLAPKPQCLLFVVPIPRQAGRYSFFLLSQPLGIDRKALAQISFAHNFEILGCGNSLLPCPCRWSNVQGKIRTENSISCKQSSIYRCYYDWNCVFFSPTVSVPWFWGLFRFHDGAENLWNRCIPKISSTNSCFAFQVYSQQFESVVRKQTWTNMCGCFGCSKIKTFVVARVAHKLLRSIDFCTWAFLSFGKFFASANNPNILTICSQGDGHKMQQHFDSVLGGTNVKTWQQNICPKSKKQNLEATCLPSRYLLLAFGMQWNMFSINPFRFLLLANNSNIFVRTCGFSKLMCLPQSWKTPKSYTFNILKNLALLKVFAIQTPPKKTSKPQKGIPFFALILSKIWTPFWDPFF